MLTAGWGLAEASEKFRAESVEEMGHAERIIGRMLALGVAPNASQLRPVRLGQTLQQLLEIDHAFEKELVKLYSDAAAHCTRCGDQDSRLFFESLLGEEQVHAKELLQWIEKLQQ
jgi:bacterioferritin